MKKSELIRILQEDTLTDEIFIMTADGMYFYEFTDCHEDGHLYLQATIVKSRIATAENLWDVVVGKE